MGREVSCSSASHFAIRSVTSEWRRRVDWGRPAEILVS